MIEKHTHIFETDPDGKDRCGCGVTFLEHVRGFGSNVAPVKRAQYAAGAASEADHAGAHTKPERVGLRRHDPV